MNNRLQAREITKKLKLDTKLHMLVGKDNWHFLGVDSEGIPDITVTDGPHGLRKKIGNQNTSGLGESIPAICYPPACTSACSFDEELIFLMGKAMGEECRKEDVSVLLGPGVNIKRNPLCGRNFEYFSEDPYVAGKMGAAMIHGVQSVGVGTSMKHFAANSQEYARLVTDSMIDQRALREIYLKAFEICIKEAKPWTVMSAYNLLNGTYCSGNKKLLTDILRKEWGYKGLVMSDWGAVDNPVKDLKAGLDIQMPGPAKGNFRILKQAYAKGKITDRDIDLAVSHIVELGLKAKKGKRMFYECDMEKNLNLARKIAEESMILLKNDKVLPLKEASEKDSICIIGEFAKQSRYQGAGSSIINPYRLDSICQAFDEEGIKYSFSSGYSLNRKLTAMEKKAYIKEAVRVAKDADTVILVVGLPESYESEGFDRSTLSMPQEQNILVEALCKSKKKVVVVVQTGGVVAMPWIKKPQAVLLSYLGGCQGGKATKNILLGRVNPSGKLAESFVKSEKLVPSASVFPGKNKIAEYIESIFVGYRYYDQNKDAVEFPFGYGLSYTNFAYKKIKIGRIKNKTTVSFDLLNEGEYAGKETVFLFVGKKHSEVIRPVKELKRFKKISLEAKEKQRVSFVLREEDFAFYSVQEQGYVVEPGEYQIYIARNADDIMLEGSGQVINSGYVAHRSSNIPSYSKVDGSFTREDFYRLIHKRRLGKRKKRKYYSMNSTIDDIKHTWIGKRLKQVADVKIKKDAADISEKRMMEASLTHMPLRQLTMQGFSYGQVEWIISLLNKTTKK